MDYMTGLALGLAFAILLVFCIEQDMIEDCQDETGQVCVVKAVPKGVTHVTD